jgi:Na+-transporting methylmalonyl-CoA/oxaloacetate decarboxylase gamma subunit
LEANINAGLAIALLGMGIVFCFIALLALAIHLLARFKGQELVPSTETPDQLMAVIGAALHTHRSFRRRVERRDVT